MKSSSQRMGGTQFWLLGKDMIIEADLSRVWRPMHDNELANTEPPHVKIISVS